MSLLGVALTLLDSKNKIVWSLWYCYCFVLLPPVVTRQYACLYSLGVPCLLQEELPHLDSDTEQIDYSVHSVLGHCILSIGNGPCFGCFVGHIELFHCSFNIVLVESSSCVSIVSASEVSVFILVIGMLILALASLFFVVYLALLKITLIDA